MHRENLGYSNLLIYVLLGRGFAHVVEPPLGGRSGYLDGGRGGELFHRLPRCKKNDKKQVAQMPVKMFDTGITEIRLRTTNAI